MTSTWRETLPPIRNFAGCINILDFPWSIMNLDIFNQIQAATRENTILPTHQQKKELNLYCPNKIVKIQFTQ